MNTAILLAAAIFGIAMLYSSVGHAGASGYLAAMAIVSPMPQEEMKAIALTLNILVGAIGSYRFIRANLFHWPTFWPFGVGAIPMAYLGGVWKLPDAVFRPMIALVLIFAAVMLSIRVVRRKTHATSVGAITRDLPPWPMTLMLGGVLGLMAGLTGTGGGIFLSPLLLLIGWATPKRTAAVSIVFVLLNSIAGLGGVIAEDPSWPAELPLYGLAAVMGGLVGSGLGAGRISGDSIRILLALVLGIAAVKMLLPQIW